MVCIVLTLFALLVLVLIGKSKMWRKHMARPHGLWHLFIYFSRFYCSWGDRQTIDLIQTFFFSKNSSLVKKNFNTDQFKGKSKKKTVSNYAGTTVEWAAMGKLNTTSFTFVRTRAKNRAEGVKAKRSKSCSMPILFWCGQQFRSLPSAVSVISWGTDEYTYRIPRPMQP